MTQTTTQQHQINPFSIDDTGTVYLCDCGWTTIAAHNPPDYHTPLADRFAKHLDEVDAIATGRVWNDVPADHRLEHFTGYSLAGPQRWNGTRAVWMGGSRIVAIEPI